MKNSFERMMKEMEHKQSVLNKDYGRNKKDDKPKDKEK